MGEKLADLIDLETRARLRAAVGLPDTPLPDVGEVDEVKGADDGGLEHKADGAAQVLSVDDETGVVEALVSVTGIEDRVKDIIEPGAYTRTMAKREPIGVWSHDDKTWVARTEHAEELMPGDPFFHGLKTMDGEPWPAEAGAVKVRSRFNLETPHGAAAFSDVKFFQGKTGWSIGYRATQAHRNPRTGVRNIKELDWYEYSPVMVGAAGQAMTLSVKSLAQPVDPDDASGLAGDELVESLSGSELERFTELKASLGLEVKKGGFPFAKGAKKPLPAGAVHAIDVKVGDTVSFKSLDGAVSGKVTGKKSAGGMVILTISGKDHRVFASAAVKVTSGDDTGAGVKLSPDELERKDRVRTPAGAKLYGQPIGSVIRKDAARKFLADTAASLPGGEARRNLTRIAEDPDFDPTNKQHAQGAATALRMASYSAPGDRGKELQAHADLIQAHAGEGTRPSARPAVVAQAEGPQLYGTSGPVTSDKARKFLADTAASLPGGEPRRNLQRLAADPNFDPSNKQDAQGAATALRMASYSARGDQAKELVAHADLIQAHAGEGTKPSTRASSNPGGHGTTVGGHQSTPEVAALQDQLDKAMMRKAPQAEIDRLHTAIAEATKPKRTSGSNSRAAQAARDSFAAARGLKLDPEELERKDRVRTAAGARRFGQPIGSEIVGGSLAEMRKYHVAVAASHPDAAVRAHAQAAVNHIDSLHPKPMSPEAQAAYHKHAVASADDRVLGSLEDHANRLPAGSERDSIHEAITHERGRRAQLAANTGPTSRLGWTAGPRVGKGPDLGGRRHASTRPSVPGNVNGPLSSIPLAMAPSHTLLDRVLARHRAKQTAGHKGLLFVDPASLVDLADVEVKMAHEDLNRSPKKNWIEAVHGQLPAYVQHIAKDISEKRGVPLDHAIPIAIGTVKRWARGGGGVKADTIAKAAAAVTEWEALKAKAGKKSDTELMGVLEAKAGAIVDAWNLLADEGLLEVKALVDAGVLIDAGDVEVGDDVEVKGDGDEEDLADLFARGAEVKSGITDLGGLRELRDAVLGESRPF